MKTKNYDQPLFNEAVAIFDSSAPSAIARQTVKLS
jgi:hypothetical protein